MLSQTDYRQILKEELDRRKSANARYSLRAFARDLDIAVARLSSILLYRQGLSEQYARKIGEKLKFEEDELKYFCELVAASDARSKSRRKAAEEKIKRLQEESDFREVLDEEAFKIISDWYHFAILELTDLDHFQSSPEWIAKTLDIPEHLAAEAIERLISVQLLKMEDGRYVQTKKDLKTTSGIPSESIREHHHQILTKATSALETQTVNERDFNSLMITVSTKRIAELKKKMAAFRRELISEFSANDNPKDSIYCISTNFFRLDEGDTHV